MPSASYLMGSQKFYLEYRLAVGYAKADPASLLPMFPDLAQWYPMKSTKMDVCTRICAHYLTDDRVPDISFDNGEVHFPTIPGQCQDSPERSRRIIIYAEFPSMAPLLQNVCPAACLLMCSDAPTQILSLYGVPSLAINGQIAFGKRDEYIWALYDDKHPARVLIFSSVGSAGLNLSIADIVIFFVSIFWKPNGL